MGRAKAVGHLSADDIRSGIRPYALHQIKLLRLLRMRGGFTSDQFDQWFRHPRREYKVWPIAIDGDGFIIGMGTNGGTYWAFMLDLLQHLIMIKAATTTRTGHDVLCYIPTNNTHRELLALERLWAQEKAA